MKDKNLEFWVYLCLIITSVFNLGINLALRASEPLPLNEANIYHEKRSTSLLEGKNEVVKGTFYDYYLDGIAWSKDHDTCASRDFPRYSTVLVKNIANGKEVKCYVNDYGPMSCKDRIKNGLDTASSCVERGIDLSSHAFKQIADTKLGIIDVEVSLVK